MSVPRATIDEVWRLRDAWAKTGREYKSAQEKSRLWALVLGFFGGLLGAVAALLAETDAVELPAPVATVIAVSAALLVALAGYLGRELVTQDRETRWARARILAEALKRECWKCLMGVPDYDQGDAGERLRQRASDLTSNVGLDREPVAKEDSRPAPTVDSPDDYVKERCRSQMDWYEQRANEIRKQLTALKFWSFVAGAVGVILGVVGIYLAMLLAFVPVATTAGTAFVAWIQAGRLAPLVDVYQQAASQLRLQLAAWLDGEETRKTSPPDKQRAALWTFVESCELIMARENDSWQAEWLTEEKVQRAIQIIKDGSQPPPQGSARVPK